MSMVWARSSRQGYVAEFTGHTITPENFLGIEINPRAAAIAQLVLWIGYLQWHFRVNGAERAPPEPILKDIPWPGTLPEQVSAVQQILASRLPRSPPRTSPAPSRANAPQPGSPPVRPPRA